MIYVTPPFLDLNRLTDRSVFAAQEGGEFSDPPSPPFSSTCLSPTLTPLASLCVGAF